MPDPKHFLKSKTIWANSIMLLIAVVATLQGDDSVKGNATLSQVLIYCTIFLNLLLRTITSQPLTTKVVFAMLCIFSASNVFAQYEGTVAYSCARVTIPCNDGRTTDCGSATLISAWDNDDGHYGLLITNQHVVRDRGTDRGIARFVNGQETQTLLVDEDPSNDLAVLLTCGFDPSIPPVPIAEYVPFPGEPIYMTGFGGSEYTELFQVNPSCPTGVTFRMGRGSQYHLVSNSFNTYTTTGEGRDGDSGGGVFNERGELVGVRWGSDPQVKESMIVPTKCCFPLLKRVQERLQRRLKGASNLFFPGLGPQAPRFQQRQQPRNDQRETQYQAEYCAPCRQQQGGVVYVQQPSRPAQPTRPLVPVTPPSTTIPKTAPTNTSPQKECDCSKEIATLQKEIEALKVVELPKDGKDGKDGLPGPDGPPGKDGQSVDPQLIADLTAALKEVKDLKVQVDSLAQAQKDAKENPPIAPINSKEVDDLIAKQLKKNLRIEVERLQ